MALVTLAFSCIVPKKQFDELLAEKVKMEADMIEMQKDIKSLSHKRDSLELALESTTSDKKATQQELATTTSNLNNLKAEHDKLQTYYNNALNNSGRMNRDMKEQHERLLAMQETLDEATYHNQKLADSLVLREEKVKELERIVAESQHAISNLKTNLNDALLDFGESDLTIEQKNGKIYISLSEQLLFKSSSTLVDPKGQKALQQLAGVLKSTPDIDILIEGHTDNVPISGKSKYLQDNWDLSVLRATSIVRILVKSGVHTDALTPAGKGQFLPVASNDTPANKAQNRRIEIIITPDLHKLFSILEQTNK